ncbi:MAG TPA: ABC transporter permease [Ktedonosporobacter sp.]|nr:ABC transporter permease [Ktedonosporobacter sp.]
MSASSQQEQVIPALPRTQTVVMGRQGFFSVVLRLIGVELYKLRCRMMSKVLAIIAILATIISSALVAWITPDPLELTNVVTLVAQTLNIVGLILIIILAGTIVGGEYSVGTVRLMLTRGPTRAQYLFAKLGAILTCIVTGVVSLTVLGSIVAVLFGLTKTGVSQFNFFAGALAPSLVWYILATILSLFVYGAMACCLSVLGKTAAAGVAGTILWWVVEGLVDNILPWIGSLSKGLLSDFLKAIPDYLIGRNISTLAQNTLAESDSTTMLASLHALLVLVGYLILFIGLAWWVNKRRDVIN